MNVTPYYEFHFIFIAGNLTKRSVGRTALPNVRKIQIIRPLFNEFL